MDALITGMRWVHVVLGFTGLAAWWVPVFTRKGGRAHVRLGKVFVVCGYVVATTAIGTSTLRLGRALWQGQQPADNAEAFGFLLFLGYLGWVALALVHHALQVVRTRRDPDSIRTPLHHLLAVVPPLGSLVVIAYALTWWSSVSVVLLALAPVGLLVCNDLTRYMYRRPDEKMAWFYAHMGAMMGAGIAFHTAFLVFGSARWLDLSILGSLNWVPWVAPAVVGSITIGVWERYYRRKFGDLPAAVDADRGVARPS